MSVFENKTLLITGGTGSFGNAVLRRFLDSDIKEVRIFSRDEKKQDDMRHFLQAQRPEVAHKVKFYIGNVRQREAQLQKIPYMLVVGGKEEENEAVSVRSRFKGDEGQMKLDDFLAAIKEEIANRENRKVEKED